MKKILIVLNYYYPYISGVSECARLIAEELVSRGYEVTVVTSKHEKLPEKEKINGVTVLRSKVWFKISKGVISPNFILRAIRMSKKYDVVNLHLPMIESGIISLFSKHKNLVATYQCDVNLPPSMINNFIVKVMDWSNGLCLKRAKKVVVTSLDYAKSSRIAFKYKNKLQAISTPIKNYNSISVKKDNKVKSIGFCGRIVEEKGIDVLIRAYEILCKSRQDIELVIGGDYMNIAGGSIYPQLRKYVEDHKLNRVKFLGKISENKMEEFYSALDVMTLPSINRLEAFGMVQIEAMLCGTPVVASDLPGVRTIVANTGMGEIAKRGDAVDLAEKIAMVIDNPQKYMVSKEKVLELYGNERVINEYIKTYFD